MEYKQSIVIRADLGMSAGKLAAQAAHASLESYKAVLKKKKLWVAGWEKEGVKKVVLKVESERDLLRLAEISKRNKIPYALIRDAGFTELSPGTITALGVGPAPEAEIDKITGNLETL